MKNKELLESLCNVYISPSASNLRYFFSLRLESNLWQGIKLKDVLKGACTIFEFEHISCNLPLLYRAKTYKSKLYVSCIFIVCKFYI